MALNVSSEPAPVPATRVEDDNGVAADDNELEECLVLPTPMGLDPGDLPASDHGGDTSKTSPHQPAKDGIDEQGIDPTFMQSFDGGRSPESSELPACHSQSAAPLMIAHSTLPEPQLSTPSSHEPSCTCQVSVGPNADDPIVIDPLPESSPSPTDIPDQSQSHQSTDPGEGADSAAPPHPHHLPVT